MIPSADPLGFHECLVMEIVLPFDTLFSSDPLWDHASFKQTLKQLFEGFKFIHSNGYRHGGKRPPVSQSHSPTSNTWRAQHGSEDKDKPDDKPPAARQNTRR